MQDVDLMAYVDSFRKTAGISSRLIYGNPELCPDPYLSIVIPTYNRPEYLKIALDSALGQSEPGIRYEVIVVDNEPSEQPATETEKMVVHYKNDNLLYYRNAENLGIAGNWNRCIQLARGHWVAFLHDDDILLPDYIQRVKSLIIKKKDVAGIIMAAHTLYEGNSLAQARVQRPVSFMSRMYETLSSGKLMRLRQTDSSIKLANIYGAPTCGSVFRKDYMIESGGFNERFHPSFDWFFLFRFCKQYKLYRSMERMGYYRVFVSLSLSEKTKAAFLRDRLTFVDFSARNSSIGGMMRRYFRNEQNNVILNEEYTDFLGKEATDFFEPAEIEERIVRKFLYRIITQGYWFSKSLFCLFFG